METFTMDDAPRSMRDAGVRNRRTAMLGQPHIAPLSAFADRLRERDLGEVPNFDPLDGGISARVLFLFEKPGPMTSERGKRKGSGVISRNNDDATAEAIFDFMQRASLPRKSVVIWNVIPCWNGTVKISRDELETALVYTTELISLLPELQAIVMVGATASKAETYLKGKGLELFKSVHPSPRVRARWPERWNAIPLEWAKAHKFIEK